MAHFLCPFSSVPGPSGKHWNFYDFYSPTKKKGLNCAGLSIIFFASHHCLRVHFMAMWCKMFNVIFLWPCQSFPLSRVCNLCISPDELYKTNCANCITCELFFKEFLWMFWESVGTYIPQLLYFIIYIPISDWPRLTAPLTIWASKQKRPRSPKLNHWLSEDFPPYLAYRPVSVSLGKSGSAASRQSCLGRHRRLGGIMANTSLPTKPSPFINSSWPAWLWGTWSGSEILRFSCRRSKSWQRFPGLVGSRLLPSGLIMPT